MMKPLSMLAVSLAMVPLLQAVPAFAQSSPAPAASTTSTTVTSSHHHGHGGPGGGHHRPSCGVFEKLNLSADQKAKLKSAHGQFRAQNGPLVQDMHAKVQQIRTLKAQGGSDDQIKALHQAIRADREQMRQKSDATMQSILTPSQFTQYQSLKQQCRAQFHHNGGGGGHHHHGGGTAPSASPDAPSS